MDATQLAIEERVAQQHRHHKKALFFWVWGGLLVMTALEVYLTYQNMEPKRMLTILMGLSLIKAALIIGFFMHLKYEDFPHEMVDHVFGNWLLDLDDDLLFSGCLSNTFLGSAMKLRLAILTLVLVAWTAPAFCQGCAMCYGSAQATSKEGQRAINKAVLVLLVPPVGFMTSGHLDGTTLREEERSRAV